MAPDETEKNGYGDGLPLAAAAVLFLVLRLFAVSGYDWHTAFAVLHTMDLGDSIGIVIGTLMADSLAAAAYLALLTPIALLWLHRSFSASPAPHTSADAHQAQPPRPGLRSGVLILLSALAALAAYVWTFHAWWLPLAALAVGGLIFALGAGAKAGGRRQRLTVWTGRRLGVLIVAAWLLAAATVRTPWVPLERLQLRDGARLTGYVLQTEPGFLKVLTEEEREFLILTDQEVASRQEIHRR
ncbi:hypothetical protein [Streptomyces sp. NPDC006879]|uniref:hypothetical protein n=1 Tax=Streptomyces sp. NPDC006879 TaxID=3364767 RepID=UPI0036BD1048